MYRVIFTFWLLSSFALADSGPQRTELTNDIAKKLGFSITDMGSGKSEIKLIHFKFPSNIGTGCNAGRIQTALLDSDKVEISSSSFDSQIASDSPSILFHYNNLKHDMAIQIQYCCTTGDLPGCKKAYTIDSVSKFLITRH
jgi:peroxiredoxin family protein